MNATAHLFPDVKVYWASVHTGPYTAVRRIQAAGHGAGEAKPSRTKKALDSALESAGLLPRHHGPWALPARAARPLPTPRRRSAAKRVRPRFHCRQTMARSRRLTQRTRSVRVFRTRRRPRLTAFTAHPPNLPPRPGWLWTSRSLARSSGRVGLVSGSCPSGRGFAPRFLQTPPRDFAAIGLDRGLTPPSCQSCAAHKKKEGRSPPFRTVPQGHMGLAATLSANDAPPCPCLATPD